MSNKQTLFVILTLSILLVTLAFPASASAQSNTSTLLDDDGGKLVIGSTYHLKSGESLNGDLVIIGGQAIIDSQSQVNGGIVVTGGSIEIDGTVNGDVFAIGGSVSLLSDTVINGDLSTIGVNLKRDEGVKINGSTNINTETLSLDIPFGQEEGFTGAKPDIRGVDLIKMGQDFLNSVFWRTFQALSLSILAAVIALLAPNPTRRVAKSVFNAPITSGAVGFLTIFVAPAVFVLLIITIILIPVGLIGFILLGIAFLFGWIAVGYELGSKVAASIKVDWTPPVFTGVGTLLLTILAAGVGWIPCVGWILPAIVSMIGLGGVIVSRFGMSSYQSSSADKPVNVSHAVQSNIVTGEVNEGGIQEISIRADSLDDDGHETIDIADSNDSL